MGLLLYLVPGIVLLITKRTGDAALAFIAVSIVVIVVEILKRIAGRPDETKKSAVCPLCNGTGIYNQPVATRVGPQYRSMRCPSCNGTGRA